MPGSFSIKLLLLLQAKHLQPAWRSCSLLLFYGYLSQSLSSHPEEISRKLTLVMTNTHQPQCPIPTKSAADRAGTLGVLEFCLFLTALSQAVHFTAWLRIWHNQNPPSFPKETHPEGCHAKESQLHLQGEGQQPKETGNVAPVKQQKISVFKGVGGKLVKCNLAPPCNSLMRTQNVTTVTGNLSSASWGVTTLHCWPRLGCPWPWSGQDILRLALGSVLERRYFIYKIVMVNMLLSQTQAGNMHMIFNLLSSKVNPSFEVWCAFYHSSLQSCFTKRRSSLWSLTYSMITSITKEA